MKLKNLKILEKFEKYGEQYDPSINYNARYFKLCNYGRHVTTRPILRETKLSVHRILKSEIKTEEKPILALCGASIIQGLKRYNNVWEKMFVPLAVI